MHKGTTIEAPWSVDEKFYLKISNFNWAKFISMMSLEDYGTSNSVFNAITGISGLISSAIDSTQNTYLTITLASKDNGNRCASIAVTYDGVAETYRNAINFNGQIRNGGYVEEKLGKEVDGGLYWIYATVDSAHANNDAVAYLWYDGDSFINEPYILPRDKVYAKKISIFENTTYEIPVSKDGVKVGNEFSNQILSALNYAGIYIY